MTSSITFIRNLRKISELPNLPELLEDLHGLKTLSSSSSVFLNSVDDQEIIDTVVDIEHEAADLVYDPSGMVVKRTVDQLKKENVELVGLGTEHRPFKHAIKYNDFHVFIQS